MGGRATLAILTIRIRLQIQQTRRGICMAQCDSIVQCCAAIGVDKICGSTAQADQRVNALGVAP